MLDFNTIFSTGLLLSVTGTLIYQMRSWPKTVFNKVRSKFIYSVKIYQNDELFDILESWLFDNYEQVYKDVEATLAKKDNLPSVLNQHLNQSFNIVYKQEENIFFIHYLGKQLFITKAKEKLDKVESIRDIYYRHYTIKGWQAKQTIHALLTHIVTEWDAKRASNSVKIYSNTMYGDWSYVNDLAVKSLDKVILRSDIKYFIKEDLDLFVGDTKWYHDRGIPYKRTYCFHGVPGNGKTTLALAIACYLKRSIYSLNLNSFENDSNMLRAFSEISKHSVLLIEDMDRVFNGRENVDSKISFSGLLNCLDGALYKEGTITIITTNHIGKLDEALLRAGRTDAVVHIPNPDNECVKRYMELFYNQPVEMNGHMFDTCMSKVQEACLQFRHHPEKAMAELWTPQK